jgi:hypothetical protein
MSTVSFWVCTECSWTSDSPDLTGPIMHETETGHRVEPTVKSLVAWGKVLGTN